MVTQVKSLLEQVEEYLNVDADTYDSDFIKSLPIVPHDATSNQGFIHAAITDPINKEIVDRTVRELKGQPWENVYAVCVSATCKQAANGQIARIANKVLPVISGRVLAQVSTLHSYDQDKIVENARRYAKAFNAEGITNDRFIIKIPTTTAGVGAAKVLLAEGIDSLGTTLFSVPQALAASQAGMCAISMYLNEPRAHAEPGVWPDLDDPALNAPMAARHVQIRDAYIRLQQQTGRKQPQMKTASFCTPGEVLAMVGLGADHITAGIPVLTDLKDFATVPDYRKGMWKVPFKEQAEDPSRTWSTWTPRKFSDPEIQALLKSDPLAANPAEWAAAAFDVDYTAPGVLDKINEADPATRDRLAFAIKRFATAEELSREFIQGLQAELK